MFNLVDKNIMTILCQKKFAFPGLWKISETSPVMHLKSVNLVNAQPLLGPQTHICGKLKFKNPEFYQFQL